jgi:nicotinamidase-related amidase
LAQDRFPNEIDYGINRSRKPVFFCAPRSYFATRANGICLGSRYPLRPLLRELALIRSLEMMTRDDALLLVVDVQEKLVPSIGGAARMTWNIRRLIDGARLLGVPVVATEQYPQGLGSTVSPLRELVEQRPAKKTFSCAGCDEVLAALQTAGRAKILVVGIETHVCVQQTALDLVAHGYRVYLAVDAVGSRDPLDHDIALRRLEASGLTLTTTESALFEWCATASAPEFKQISALVKEAPPAN